MISTTSNGVDVSSFFSIIFMKCYDFALSCSIYYSFVSLIDTNPYLLTTICHFNDSVSVVWSDNLSYLNATNVAVNIIDIKESKIPSKQIYSFSPCFNSIITIFTIIRFLLIEWNSK